MLFRTNIALWPSTDAPPSPPRPPPRTAGRGGTTQRNAHRAPVETGACCGSEFQGHPRHPNEGGLPVSRFRCSVSAASCGSPAARSVLRLVVSALARGCARPRGSTKHLCSRGSRRTRRAGSGRRVRRAAHYRTAARITAIGGISKPSFTAGRWYMRRPVFHVATCGAAIECGHAVDDARVHLGAGFKWVAVRKMKKGNVPASGRDGTPLSSCGRLFLEMTAATKATTTS
jgi:hypothetical protein